MHSVKTLDIETVLSNLSKINLELYTKLEPVLSCVQDREWNKDDLIFALMVGRFQFTGTLVDLVNEVFTENSSN
jgi:hypothetical protein